MSMRAPIASIASVVFLVAASALGDEHPARHFEVRYTAKVAVPARAKSVRVWVPYPESDPWQTVRNVSVDAPLPYRIRHDPEYGNAILYLEGDAHVQHEVEIAMTFDVERREYVNRPGDGRSAEHGPEPASLLDRFRKPDRLVPIEGQIAKIALEATQGRETPADKARAIYEYVTSHMRYDKSGQGWGRGDAIWACDARRGNCTDFHSLLIGMARAVGIPAKFEIGLPLPADGGEGTIPGYHCWASLYIDGAGWVPVDSSEASKHPEKKDYFFGALDTNRVRLTVGRDIVLDPPQSGEPVNFLVYPYVEVDGLAQPPLTPYLSFRDLSRPSAAQAERSDRSGAS